MHASFDPLLELPDHFVENSEAKAGGLSGKKSGHGLEMSALAQELRVIVCVLFISQLSKGFASSNILVLGYVNSHL